VLVPYELLVVNSDFQDNWLERLS